MTSYLDLGIMCNGRLSIFCRNNHLKNTIWILLHRMRLPAPIVCLVLVHQPKKEEIYYRRERNTEFTNKECLRCIRRPFPVGDVVLAIHIESESLFSLV